ncbi:MAG: TIGR03982 family His-Xaa-Ser system protein [Methylophilaceae bacterium]|nr:TIGR03982 family His-Xaa-Ser system protein [Methylophilaceae bacterium]
MKADSLRLLNIVAKLVIAIGMITFLAFKYARPWVAELRYSEEYKRLTYECDNAMHDEISIRSSSSNSDKDIRLLKSADIGLIVCHDYDKLRKKLLILGVSEDQLALYGLEVLENQMIPTSRMVDPHRMDRF